MANTYKTLIESPLGYLEISTDEYFLLSIVFKEEFSKTPEFVPEILKKTVSQLNEYFTGKRKTFDIKLKPQGTDFQQKVWNEVKLIPFGTTQSYLELAVKTGSKNNTRAVGMANGKNPIPIIIPCHRVIGTSGKLTGYAGGIERKKWLLQHELKYSNRSDLLF